MNSYQAKQIPLVEILAILGYWPVRKDKGGVEWVYDSPFREEKEPSLFVNVKKNIWNDFGDIGGNVLDFVMRYKSTNVKGALAFLDDIYLSLVPITPQKRSRNNIKVSRTQERPSYKITGVMPLKSAILESYLSGRGIDLVVAKENLQVINFEKIATGAKYFGVGIKNLSGGYEIRNERLKTVVGAKDISYFKGSKSKNLVIFEGVMDFLSYLSEQKTTKLQSDVLILNSTKLIERAKTFAINGGYSKIYTFFDNDKSGETADKAMFELENKEIITCRHIYSGYKDYNEYWKSKLTQQGRF